MILTLYAVWHRRSGELLSCAAHVVQLEFIRHHGSTWSLCRTYRFVLVCIMSETIPLRTALRVEGPLKHQMMVNESGCDSSEQWPTHLVIVRMFQWCFVDGLETQSLPLEARVCWPFKSPAAAFSQSARMHIYHENILERRALSCLDAFTNSSCHQIIC
jgi:hypothetical protein